jgi:uncharacterized protein (DUF1501 family)
MHHHSGCHSYRNLPALQRRSFVKAGAIGSLGLSLGQTLRTEAATRRSGKAKSIILLWLQGGVSHHETFDPKPDATSDVRGEFLPISTKLPGVQINEFMPRTAGILDKIAVVRSLKHAEGAHERGSMYVVEGRRPAPTAGTGPSGNPQLGCMVGHELGSQGPLPPFFSIPGNDFTSRFLGHGWLPATSGPFKGFQKDALRTAGAKELERLQDRLALRGELSGQRRELDRGTWDAFDQRAIDLVTSGQGADAFDLSREPAALKERYGLVGKLRDDMASLCLTARRLVEAGVRYVTVGRDSWDHHSDIFSQLKSRVPLFDMAFAALVTDLEERGMLDETLVVYLTEFGRTPKINKDVGRDHWPNACSVAFAGAGIRGGQVLGATDRQGAEVIDSPVTPEEIAATILHLAGIDPQTTFLRNDGRPIHFVDTARPISALLA